MSTITHYLKTHTAIASIAAIIALSASGGAVHYASKAFASAESQTIEQILQKVEIATAEAQNIRIWSEFSGRLEAIDNVDVRPRVGGTITEVLFKEGAIVQKGDPLFVIDPRPYKASLERTKAALQAAESEVRLAEIELKRAKDLVKKQIVSESRYDTVNNAYKVAVFNVNAAKADLTQAELNYEYAHIKAPVSGRISRAEITVGNVIEAGANAPVLTSIVSTDKLYAEFDVDEQTYLKTVRASKEGVMPVALSLPGDEEAVYNGVVHSFDNQFDVTSGTIRARAVLDNTDGALVPGMYANIRLGSAQAEPTILVNDKAISTDQDKKYVYIISNENEVTYREVKLGRSIEGYRVVLDGINVGEKVLVNSLQRVRPGVKVDPVDIAAKDGTSNGVDRLAYNQ